MAAGSHTTWGGNPRVCHKCGGRLRISGADGPLWLDTYRKRSYHFACRLEGLRARAR